MRSVRPAYTAPQPLALLALTGLVFTMTACPGGGDASPTAPAADTPTPTAVATEAPTATPSNRVAVVGQVVDVDGIGLGYLDLVFVGVGERVEATTQPDGGFETQMSPGSWELSISQGESLLRALSLTILPDGAIDVGSTLTVELPEDRGGVFVPVVTELPALFVDPPRPVGGGAVKVDITWPGATHIDLSVSGQGCGDIISSSVSGEALLVSGAVAAYGRCALEAVVMTPDGEERLSGTFDVAAANADPPAMRVSGAQWSVAPLPLHTDSADGPILLAGVVPEAVINGGTTQVRLEVDDPQGLADILNVRVSLDGQPGHFVVPAQVEGSSILFEMQVDPDYFRTPEEGGALRATDQTQVGISVALEDRSGHISELLDILLEILEVQSGDVQVSLSWDTFTDVDLHVVEPNGEEIFYGNQVSSTGGRLDLDSNPACAIDGVNNENVFWAEGEAPTGEYIVRVDYWSSCGGQPANYVVTVRTCGEIRTYRGSFVGSDADEGSLGDGVEVARFDSGCGYGVAGRATYEDFAPTVSGLSTTGVDLPIRFGRVEVRREVDDAVLGVGSTDENGRFDLSFENDGEAGVYVVVLAEQDDARVSQAVQNANGEIYAVRSEGFNEAEEPRKRGVEIDASRDRAGAAFNIFDMGIVGASLIRERHAITPPALVWQWQEGDPGVCGGSVSCYQRSAGRIYVLSSDENSDEYDDAVLLHEFGHFYQYNLSDSDSPGGPHSLLDRVDPRLAWGEGSATFFGNFALGASLYLDTNAGGVGVRFDVEDPTWWVPNGTDPSDDQGGLISEAVVAAILWDLADDANEAPLFFADDTVTQPTGVFRSLGYLSASVSDRGQLGTDLIDFLDAWFCLGQGERGDSSTGVEGLVTGMWDVPYDFAGDSTCAEEASSVPVTGRITASDERPAVGDVVNLELTVTPERALPHLKLEVLLPSGLSHVEGELSRSYEKPTSEEALKLNLKVRVTSPEPQKIVARAVLADDRELTLTRAFVVTLGEPTPPSTPVSRSQDSKGNPIVVY